MSLVTAGDICSKALQMTGANGGSAIMTDADGQLMLDLLSSLMDMWSNFNLACYAILEQSAPLVPNQSAYTIGPGGNFNMTRPLKIIGSPGSCYVQDTNGNNYDMQVVARDTWNLYTNRSDLVTSNFPNILFYDPQNPLGIINILPFPTMSYMMFWDSYLQLADYTDLNQQIDLPPGYKLAMLTNLAVLAKPFFLDGAMDPVIPVIASSSLGAIKRTNTRDNVSLYDPEIVARASLSYNIYTDSVGSVNQN